MFNYRSSKAISKKIPPQGALVYYISQKLERKKIFCKEKFFFICDYLISQLIKRICVFFFGHSFKAQFLASIPKTLAQNIILSWKYIMEAFML